MEIIGHQRARGVMDKALGRQRAKRLYAQLSSPDVFTPFIPLPSFGQRLLLASDKAQRAALCALVNERELDTLRKYIDAAERSDTSLQTRLQAGRAIAEVDKAEKAPLLHPTQAALIREELRLMYVDEPYKLEHAAKAREWLDASGATLGPSISQRRR